ncbi:MAG TPA: hypothetical protein O0X27_00790 [Methanocorpusculum sp.]|nr:hypothetical protein [Methanocorpusculum sp.]
MKIKGITLRIPPALLGVIVLFAAICAFCLGSTHNPLYLYLGIPMIIILIVLPLVLTYSSEKQVINNIDAARSVAKVVRARQVTAAMRGTTVILEGKILRVTGLYMNKPVYLIEDPTGTIVVKRFALPDPLVGPGAIVEVLGRVYGRAKGSVFINALTVKPIRKIREVTDQESAEPAAKEQIHIKHYN